MKDSTSIFLEDANDVLNRIRSLFAIPVEQRNPKLSDDDLKDVQYKIEEIRVSVETGQLPPKSMRHELSRSVIDHWPLQAELSAKIIELEQLYRRL